MVRRSLNTVSWDGSSSLPAPGGFQEAWHHWVNFCAGLLALMAPGVTCHLLGDCEPPGVGGVPFSPGLSELFQKGTLSGSACL